MRLHQIFESGIPNRVEQDGNVYYFDDEGKLHRDGDLPAIEWADGKKSYYRHGEEYVLDHVKPKIRPKITKSKQNQFVTNVTLTWPDGTIEWVREYDHEIEYIDAYGMAHRDNDLPARINSNGTKSWFQHGKRHRDGDQPAEIRADGTMIWYQHGRVHRDGDQPAVIYADGAKTWYQNGNIHRDGDQPALIGADGSQNWYQHGMRHRDGDQPAEIRADGTMIWYNHGKQYHSNSAVSMNSSTKTSKPTRRKK